MQRQVWVFLTKADEEALLARLSGAFPVRALRGRYFQGTVDDLRRDPGSLETKDLRRGEHFTHLIHESASESLVADRMEDGPFAGWMRLDDVRSEVVSLVRMDPENGSLAPSRVQSSTHAWFSGKRLKKSHAFSRFTSELLQLVEEYPRTAFDWMHVAPGAEAFVREGGRLQYLYKTVALTPDETGTMVTRPHKGR